MKQMSFLAVASIPEIRSDLLSRAVWNGGGSLQATDAHQQGDSKLANAGHASPPPASLWPKHQRKPGGWTQVEARQGMPTW